MSKTSRTSKTLIWIIHFVKCKNRKFLNIFWLKSTLVSGFAPLSTRLTVWLKRRAACLFLWKPEFPSIDKIWPLIGHRFYSPSPSPPRLHHPSTKNVVLPHAPYRSQLFRFSIFLIFDFFHFRSFDFRFFDLRFFDFRFFFDDDF